MALISTKQQQQQQVDLQRFDVPYNPNGWLFGAMIAVKGDKVINVMLKRDEPFAIDMDGDMFELSERDGVVTAKLAYGNKLVVCGKLAGRQQKMSAYGSPKALFDGDFDDKRNHLNVSTSAFCPLDGQPHVETVDRVNVHAARRAALVLATIFQALRFSLSRPGIHKDAASFARKRGILFLKAEAAGYKTEECQLGYAALFGAVDRGVVYNAKAVNLLTFPAPIVGEGLEAERTALRAQFKAVIDAICETPSYVDVTQYAQQTRAKPKTMADDAFEKEHAAHIERLVESFGAGNLPVPKKMKENPKSYTRLAITPISEFCLLQPVDGSSDKKPSFVPLPLYGAENAVYDEDKKANSAVIAEDRAICIFIDGGISVSMDMAAVSTGQNDKKEALSSVLWDQISLVALGPWTPPYQRTEHQSFFVSDNASVLDLLGFGPGAAELDERKAVKVSVPAGLIKEAPKRKLIEDASASDKAKMIKELTEAAVAASAEDNFDLDM